MQLHIKSATCSASWLACSPPASEIWKSKQLGRPVPGSLVAVWFSGFSLISEGHKTHRFFFSVLLTFIPLPAALAEIFSLRVEVGPEGMADSIRQPTPVSPFRFPLSSQNRYTPSNTLHLLPHLLSIHWPGFLVLINICLPPPLCHALQQ